MKAHYSFRLLPAALALSFLAVSQGCSSNDDDDGGGWSGTTGLTFGGSANAQGGANSTGATSSTGSTASRGGGSNGTGSTTGTGSTGSGSGGSGNTGNGGKTAACEGVPYEESSSAGGDDGSGEGCMLQFEQEAVSIPVDLYIMMDRSVSMNNEVPNSDPVITRWDAIREAMEQFVEQASAEDLRAGINFFGASRYGGDDAVDCDVDGYATPKVEIAQIADVGADLVAAIEENVPAGLTPTLPALQGAVKHAKDWVESGEADGRAVVVVLVTDGYPTQCQKPVSIPELEAVAKEAWESSKIRTYVVGLDAGFNLDSIARAGGTQSATLLDEGEPASSLVDALLGITNRQISCNYDLPQPPDDMVVDKDKVQVLFTPSKGAQVEIPRVGSSASCDRSANGGWFYDNPNDPKSISLCPCSCTRVQKAGHVNVTVGCAPTFEVR